MGIKHLQNFYTCQEKIKQIKYFKSLTARDFFFIENDNRVIFLDKFFSLLFYAYLFHEVKLLVNKWGRNKKGKTVNSWIKEKLSPFLTY